MKTIIYGVTFCSLATLTALQEIHLHSNTQSNDSESSIEGYVLDDSGPVPSVRVAVTELKPSVTTNGVRIAIAGLNSALTTADGHYVIKSSYFRDRTVFLSCRKIGYDCGPPKRLSPASSTDVRRLDFRAQKEAVLAGQVLDADKQPVEGIEVDVYVKRFRDGHPIFILQDSDVTNDLGRYRIPNLTQGVYYVTGTPKTGMARSAPTHPIDRESKVKFDKVRTFYPASPFIDAAVPISLTPGEQRDGVDITLIEMPTYCVHGVPTAQAIMHKTFIQVVSTAIGWWGGYGRSEIKLGEQFEICGLPTGSYKLLISSWSDKEEGPPKLTGFANTDFAISRSDIDLKSIAISAGISMSGDVIIADSDPPSAIPAGIVVGFSPVDRPATIVDMNLSGVVRPSGDFHVDYMFPDQYRVRVRGLPRGYYLKEISQSGYPADAHIVNAGTNIRIRLARDGPTITGQAIEHDHRPAQGATVVLIPKSAATATVTAQRADQNGGFSFDSDIAPGEYRLLAFEGLLEGEDGDPEFLNAHLRNAISLNVGPNGARSLVITAEQIR